jgi:hypothetical protein
MPPTTIKWYECEYSTVLARGKAFSDPLLQPKEYSSRMTQRGVLWKDLRPDVGIPVR